MDRGRAAQHPLQGISQVRDHNVLAEVGGSITVVSPVAVVLRLSEETEASHRCSIKHISQVNRNAEQSSKLKNDKQNHYPRQNASCFKSSPRLGIRIVYFHNPNSNFHQSKEQNIQTSLTRSNGGGDTGNRAGEHDEFSSDLELCSVEDDGGGNSAADRGGGGTPLGVNFPPQQKGPNGQPL